MTQEQQKIAQIVQEKNQMLGDLFEKKLNSETFPVERISTQFRQFGFRALMKSRPYGHKIGLAEFAKVVGCDPNGPLTLFQFGVMANSLEAVSPEELCIGATDYVSLINEVVANIEVYQKRIVKLREEVQIEVEKSYQMKMAAAGVNNGLKPVAEA